MQFLNKIPVKKRLFRGMKKRIAGKHRGYNLDMENESVIALNLKIGSVCSDHSTNHRIQELRQTWVDVTKNSRKWGQRKRASQKWGRYLETVIVFNGGGYPCGCTLLHPPVTMQEQLDDGLSRWLECSYDDVIHYAEEWHGASLTDKKKDEIVAAWNEGQELSQQFRLTNDMSLLFYEDGVAREVISQISNRILNGDR